MNIENIKSEKQCNIMEWNLFLQSQPFWSYLMNAQRTRSPSTTSFSDTIDIIPIQFVQFTLSFIHIL